MYQRTLDATQDIQKGYVSLEPGKAKLVATRREVANGWRSVGELLAKEGQTELARQVRRFLDRMPPPQTERETIAERSPGRTPGIDKPHLTR
jgi:hypothetical protein